MKHPKVEHEASRRGVCGGENVPATCAVRDAERHLGVGRRTQSPRELHPARWETRAGAAGLFKAAGGTGAPFRTHLSTAGCFG